MARNFGKPLQGLLDDGSVSFNIRRLEENRTPFPRKVVILNSSPTRRSVIPGLAEKREPGLSSEIRKSQKCKDVTEFAAEIPPCRYAMPWRFRTDPAVGLRPFGSLEPAEPKVAKKMKAVSKRFLNHIQSNLKPGRIFLIPDAEVTFGPANRLKQSYARPVLVAAAGYEQITVIPFSTRIERLNRQTDILFDRGYEGTALDPEGFPAVENFPHKNFSRKSALIVSAAQPMAREVFLEVALVPSGSVRRELLSFVINRLKNIESLTFIPG